MNKEELVPRLAAKLAAVSTWEMPGFVIEPLDALAWVGKDGLEVTIFRRSDAIASVQGATTLEVAEAFLAVMSLLFVKS